MKYFSIVFYLKQYSVMTSPYIHTDELTKELIDKYPNIHFKFVNINTFLEGTTLYQLWREYKVQTSDYVISHLSDLLR